MSPVFAARRRAEEFQSMVEGASAAGGSDARLLEFLEIVETLRETPEITARPAFVADLREQLLDEARTLARTGKGADAAARLTVTRSTTERRRERRLAAAVGGLALVGASTGMAVASQSALPGDPLYPLKRAIENAQTGVQTDEDAKGKSLLDNASGRLDEVDQLSRENDDAATIAATLDTFTDQASEASDLLLSDYAETGSEDSVEELRSFTADSMAALTALQEIVPEDARGALISAARTLTQIDQRALLACPSCGPDLVTEIPSLTPVALDDLQDLLGAVTTTVQSPQQPAKKDGKKGDKAPTSPTTDDTIDLPDVPEVLGGSDDKKTDKGDKGLLDPLTDPLTKKNKKDKDDGGGGLLEDTADGISGLLGGLLGN
jgi:hypothetical protein